MTRAHGPTVTCPRCGRKRKAHTGREGLCGDCRSVEPDWPDVAREWEAS